MSYDAGSPVHFGAHRGQQIHIIVDDEALRRSQNQSVTLHDGRELKLYSNKALVGRSRDVQINFYDSRLLLGQATRQAPVGCEFDGLVHNVQLWDRAVGCGDQVSLLASGMGLLRGSGSCTLLRGYCVKNKCHSSRWRCGVGEGVCIACTS
jgi:hypothetical protein